MARQLRCHPDVVSDLSEAIERFDSKSRTLGDRFRLEVNTRFGEILAHPERFPRAFEDGDYRFARLPKFQYLVLFQLRNDVVYVAGIFHSASDPDKWRGRM